MYTLFTRLILGPGCLIKGFPCGSVVKNLPANTRATEDAGLIPGLEKSPWSRNWQFAPIFLPGKFHGQRNLAG